MSPGQLMQIWRLQRSEVMIIGMSIRTAICQDSWMNFTRFTLNETLLKGYNKPGGRLMKIQTTSRPDYIWPDALTRILGKRTCVRETVVPK